MAMPERIWRSVPVPSSSVKRSSLLLFFTGLAVLDLHRAEVGLAEGVEVHLLLGLGLHLHGGEGGLPWPRPRRPASSSASAFSSVHAGEEVLALGDRRRSAAGRPMRRRSPRCGRPRRADLAQRACRHALGHEGGRAGRRRCGWSPAGCRAPWASRAPLASMSLASAQGAFSSIYLLAR